MKQATFKISNIEKIQYTTNENQNEKNEKETSIINKPTITSVKPIKVVENIYYFN